MSMSSSRPHLGHCSNRDCASMPDWGRDAFRSCRLCSRQCCQSVVHPQVLTDVRVVSLHPRPIQILRMCAWESGFPQVVWGLCCMQKFGNTVLELSVTRVLTGDGEDRREEWGQVGITTSLQTPSLNLFHTWWKPVFCSIISAHRSPW